MQRSSCGMASSHIYTAVFILLPPHPTPPDPPCFYRCHDAVCFLMHAAVRPQYVLSRPPAVTTQSWLMLKAWEPRWLLDPNCLAYITTPPSALLPSLSAFSFLFLVSTGLHELIGPSSWSQQFSFPVPMKPTTVRFIWTVADQRSARYVSNSVPY